MCRACGTRPSAALASSAARWRTPNRCCSSTTHSARSRKCHRLLDQRVGAHHQRQLARGQPRQQVAPAGGGGRAGEQLDRHRPAEQPVERDQVLLGQRLGGRHQRGLAARSRPRAAWRAAPPRSCRCRPRPSAAAASAARRRGRRRSRRRPRRWSPVSANGSELRHASTSEPSPGSGGARAGRAPCGAPAAGHRQLQQEQLLEGEPAARSATPRPRCRGSGRRPGPPGRSARRSATRSAAGRGSTAWRIRP